MIFIVANHLKHVLSHLTLLSAKAVTPYISGNNAQEKALPTMYGGPSHPLRSVCRFY